MTFLRGSRFSTQSVLVTSQALHALVGRFGEPRVDLHLKLAYFCMSELTLPDSARSNTVKQLDRRNRGNFECKYMLFLVQISMQIHTDTFRSWACWARVLLFCKFAELGFPAGRFACFCRNHPLLRCRQAYTVKVERRTKRKRGPRPLSE